MTTYKDTEFLSAKEKELVVKRFKRFVKSLIEDFGKEHTDKYGTTLDLSFRYFTKRIYEHLHLHCGFIAHYDIHGFYNTYFNGDIEDLKNFISHFYDFKNKDIGSSKFLYTFDSDFGDINIEIGKILKENLNELFKIFGDNTREQDLITAKNLLRKHNINKLEI